MRRLVAEQDAVSCARASQARPGRPGVAVRAHYGALPPFVGWTWTGKGGEIPLEAVPEARSPGPKPPRWRADRRRGSS